MPALTIAICTKNRPESLVEVLRSLRRAFDGVNEAIEVLIVSDGSRLPSHAECTAAAGRDVSIRLKRENEPAGLYASRRVAVHEANGSSILFLDDDAHPDAGYLQRLLTLLREHPHAQGFGGIDHASLPMPGTRFPMAYARAFLLAGSSPGELSPTGFNHSQMIWREQKATFESQFLHGCNMTFRRDALLDLPDAPWLSGHACTEDLLISGHAARKGPLYVDPLLGVRHLPAEGGRGTASQRLRTMLVNQASFQAWRGRPSLAMQAWSMLGLFLRDFAMPARKLLGRREVVEVYLRALADVRTTFATQR